MPPDRAAAKLRELLATARATSPATVVDDVAALLPSDTIDMLRIIRGATELREDLETFGFVLNELLRRYPNHPLRGFGDNGAAEDLLADEEAAERDRDHTS